MVELDNILSELRGSAKLLAKDLISGVEMVRFASLLMIFLGLFMAVFAMLYLYILPLYQGASCCYVLTIYNLIGGLASIVGVVVAFVYAAKLRRKHASLKVRYKKLLELETSLED